MLVLHSLCLAVSKTWLVAVTSTKEKSPFRYWLTLDMVDIILTFQESTDLERSFFAISTCNRQGAKAAQQTQYHFSSCLLRRRNLKAACFVTNG